MRGRRCRKGVIAVAFGVGLLVTSFCPTNTMIVLLALVIICLGLSSVRW